MLYKCYCVFFLIVPKPLIVTYVYLLPLKFKMHIFNISQVSPLWYISEMRHLSEVGICMQVTDILEILFSEQFPQEMFPFRAVIP